LGFLEDIKARAKTDKKTIVLPESGDRRTLDAAAAVLAEGLAELILIGSRAKIDAQGLDLSGVTFIDPENYEKTDALAAELAELRKSKGMTPEEAGKLLRSDPLYLGVMLVKTGIADGMVAGAVYSTANVLRPSLQILKTKPQTKLVSSCLVMVVPNCDMGADGTFVFSDCALVQNPSADELAAIAVASAESFRSLVGKEPIVAMLSHSTMGSAQHADVTKVREAAAIAKSLAPGLKLDGEFQLDAAIVPSIGQKKAPGNHVSGNANVLIFPDLDAGNIGYKLVERFAGAEAYGPVTQGMTKPVNDLSRGCSASDIIGVVAITAVQAQKQ